MTNHVSRAGHPDRFDATHSAARSPGLTARANGRPISAKLAGAIAISRASSRTFTKGDAPTTAVPNDQRTAPVLRSFQPCPVGRT